MAQSFDGVVIAEIIEVRFAFSGKVVSVKKQAGDAIKQGEVIASVDRKPLQTELDRQLADYEKVRAEFEIFNIKSGQAGDDITKFLRQEKQAQLNASVKEVELAQYRLDHADLVSPVEGTIVDMQGLAAGLHVTPASNPVTIVARSPLRFRFTVSQKELSRFLTPATVRIKLDGLEKEYSGTTRVPVTGKDGTFPIEVQVEDGSGLLPGMVGNVTV